MPADLRHWVTHQLPGLATVVDVSWPRGCSRVWRAASGTDEVYVKRSPTPENYAREVHAYEHAARFAPHEIPRLLATDPGLRAIMTSPLPGLIVRGLCLTAEGESRVHELAGRLLRRWHDLPEPPSARARKVIRASVTEQADEAAACLERTAEHLTDAQRALVAQVSRELPRLVEDLPVVFRHGDYSPRNWLWDTERGTHGLIDFEQSDHGIAVEDFVWLCGAVWPTRPDLKTAFLAGYGRRLSDAEQRALPLLTVRLAVSYLNSGITKQEPMLVERGRTALTHLVGACG
ncbi:MAG: aminoglycoside phosphotransferase family protein [Pseudonocardiales bacterium]|nr:aminoglycoside phosphotransferase family protein [Pseudonocardiales bacterium]